MDRLQEEAPKLAKAAVAALKREWAARPEFVVLWMIAVSLCVPLVPLHRSRVMPACAADQSCVDRVRVFRLADRREYGACLDKPF